MKDLKMDYSAPKKERTSWQKFTRGFWIIVGGFAGVVVLGLITMLASSPSEDMDLTDNQQYVATVSHDKTVYTYYCTGYIRNLSNGSFVLIDYKGEATNELFITSTTYFQVKKNPKYKEEYFQKLEKEKIKGKEKIQPKAV